MRSCESRAGTCFIETIIFMWCAAALFESLEDQATVSAAEAEGVRKRVIDAHGPGLIGHIIEIAIRVRKFVVDGRRRDLIADGERGNTGFHSTRTTEQVTGHRFGGTHRQLIGVLAEGTLET